MQDTHMLMIRVCCEKQKHARINEIDFEPLNGLDLGHTY